MKKFLKITVLLSVILLFSFLVACNFTSWMLNKMEEGDRADRIIMMTDLNLAGEETYQMVSISTLITEIMGETISETDKVTATFITVSDSEYIYQEKIESLVNSKTGEDERIEISGYQDGYMYKYFESEDVTARLKSQITVEEFDEHMMNMQDDSKSDINKDSCSKVSAIQNEDGDWLISYSQFKKDSLEDFLEDMGNPQVYFENYDIVDVIVEFEVSPKFVLEKSTIEFVFEENSSKDNGGLTPMSMKNNMPVCKIEYGYSYGDSVEIGEDIDLDDKLFTTVDDLRTYDIVDKQLDEMKNSEDASAKMEYTSKVSFKGNANSSKVTEDISYKIKDGKTQYEIKVSTDNENYSVVYSDGTEEYYDENNDFIDSEKISELQAKISLDSHIEPAMISLENIVDIDTEDNGEYVFTLVSENDELKEIAASVGGTLSRSKFTVTVKMEEGKIVSYVYEISAGIKIPGYGSWEMKYDQKYVCTYNY